MIEDINIENAVVYSKSQYKKLLDIYIDKNMTNIDYNMNKILAVSLFWDVEHDDYQGAVDALYKLLMKKLGKHYHLGFLGFPEIHKVSDTQYIMSCSVALLNEEDRVLM